MPKKSAAANPKRARKATQSGGLGRALVIVESPTKARTIRDFLPDGFTVAASMGHVRDLPSDAKEIPAKYKGQDWARFGVDVANDFAPLYVVPADKRAVVRELKDELKNAGTLYLATDEDREGESISWHLLDVLQPRIPVRRMVFHEITREAIQEALAHYSKVAQMDFNYLDVQARIKKLKSEGTSKS